MILVGDCRVGLRSLEAGSVQTCVTSPPYFGLRDYGHHGQIGLEPTPDEFVAALVSVFREVRRVLRDDGTVWLNLGDSYSGSGKGARATTDVQKEVYVPVPGGPEASMPKTWPGVKPKDLVGIPWMVAFALRADGWYLRSEIIWAKRNCMPESVTDRPTKAHEQIFLLSKRPSYFYDADAVREDNAGTDHPRAVLDGQPSLEPSNGLAGPHKGIRTVDGRNGAGRNRRSVWHVATQPYAGAHFATFPPKLIEPCILAGSAPRDVVLDPFAGAGTVGVVCGWHGREHVGLELNPEYAAMAEQRIALEGRPGGRPSHHEPVSVVAEQLGLL